MSVKQRACQRCQKMISVGRLEVFPETRLCAECSQETGGDMKLRVTTRNTGKSGSLKQTGTDIDGVEWERRQVPPLEE
jgi:hypothetical protein